MAGETMALDLVKKGLSIQTLTTEMAQQMSRTKGAARDFFKRTRAVKQKNFFAGARIGYRPIGGEYVTTPAQWDINESLSYSINSPYELIASEASEFFNQASILLIHFDDIVRKVIEELSGQFASLNNFPLTINDSWIQVNYYRRSVAIRANRELMQGKHEDGHLLTLWNAAERGMEIFLDGPNLPSVPITLEDNELLIMPGNLLTKATGNVIQPMYHQVRCDNTVDERLSIMYFVNPLPCSLTLLAPSNNQSTNLSEADVLNRLIIRPGNPDQEFADE